MLRNKSFQNQLIQTARVLNEVLSLNAQESNVVWQKKDGSYLVGIDNMTVPIPEGVTVLTRLCGFNDRSLVTLLQNAGLPLVFAATDHPY